MQGQTIGPLRISFCLSVLIGMESLPLVPEGFDHLQEIFLIGDLHADRQCAEEWVRKSGFIDLDAWKWTGGAKRALVFMGDYVDKGPYGRHVLEFVRNLTESFPDHIVAMLGNHDLYMLADVLLEDGATQLMGSPVRNFAYAFTHPEEYLNWIPEDQRQRNDTLVVLPALYEALQYVYSRRAQSRVMMPDLFKFAPPFSTDKSFARIVKARLREFQTFLSQGMVNTGLAAWLGERPLVAVLGNALIVHGGLPPSLLLSLDQRLGVATALDLATTKAFQKLWSNHELAPGFLNGNLQEHLGKHGNFELIHEAVTYRGLHGGRHGGGGCPEVSAILEALKPEADVDLIIVGHTPADSVRISCDGRFVAADSSLSRYFRAYGNLYCPVAVDAPRIERSGCEDGVAERCEGQASRLQHLNGKWSLKPVALGDIPDLHPRVAASEL